MLALEFRFPTGRYHATPSDHHVNEGVVEWPPSPWRLLRALISVWHQKATEDVDRSTLVSLIENLAAGAPSYSLPPAIASHTRHYVPLYRDKTAKIFDTFVDVRGRDVPGAPGTPLVVVWPELTLNAKYRRALDVLLDRLGYLGRAESWVEARVVDSSPPLNTFPVAEREGQQLSDRRGVESFRLLGPMSATDLDDWRTPAIEERLSMTLADKKRKAMKRGKATDGVALTKREREDVEKNLPESVFAALEQSFGDVRKQEWSRAPGSRWIDYVRPRDALASRAHASRSPVEAEPTMARFALASNALPHFTAAVSVADRVRAALMSRCDAAPVFAGRGADDGERLTGHRHAFVLPEANGAHGRVTHVTVFAEMGFEDSSRAALESLTRVWGRGGHDIQLVLIGVGLPEDFAGSAIQAGQCALVTRSMVWESRTPFVPTRHPKCSRAGQPKLDEHGLHVGSPEHDLRRLLMELGLPQPVRVEPIASTPLGGKHVRWAQFHTERKQRSGRRAAAVGSGFRLHFAAPIRGPIALGYGAHFGLGGFVPAGAY